MRRTNYSNILICLHLAASIIWQKAALAQNDTLSPALDPTLSPTLATLTPSSATITPTIATRSPALELSPTLVPSLSPTTAVGNATLSPTPVPSQGNTTLSPSPSPSSLRNATLSPSRPPTSGESSISPTYSPSYAPSSVTKTLAPSSVDTTLSPTRMTSAPTIESTTLSSLSPSSGKTSEPTTISPTFNNATALPTFTSTMDSTMSPTPSPSEENRTSTDAPSLILSASPTATLTTLNPANQQPTLSPTLLATSELPTEYPEMIRPPTPYPTYFREVHGWYNEPWGDVPKNAKSGKGYPVNSRSEKSTTNSLVGNGWVEEGVWLISKSSKKTIGFAYDESFQHVMSMGYGAGTTPPPKLTGKASRFINDPKVPTWNAPIMNSIDDSGVDNGIKIAAKAGKGSNLTGGDSIIVTVSKSSKTILENTQQSVDYSYMEKAAKEQTFGAPKTTKVPIPKSAKKLSDVFSDALSIEFATDFGRIKPTSKSGKNSKLQSDDVVILSSKSAKNTGSLLSKSGKSALKSTKTQYQSINYNGGKVMTKSAKSFASKSSKTSFDTTVTPEEAGLPFRAKSSKSIPILNIYSEE
eukprot:CCRYP_018551-RC/>CCRYP_018551-RC protein AED:0.06 eAED:0.06 QI:324/1/1/1/0.70/0.72/18/483/583